MPKSQLGESPCWDIHARRLYWTDIKGGIIHRYDPLSGTHETCFAPKMAAFVLPAQDGTLVAGLEDGLYRVDFEQTVFSPIALLNESDVRLNDGKCDPVGRIWFGTMPLEEAPDDRTGKLYRFTDKIEKMDENFSLANGKGWTKDGRFFYHADTHLKTVWCYRYDIDRGSIAGRKAFIHTEGPPDGLCLDSNGNIYIAMYGEGRIDIYTKEGQKQNSITIPVKEVTSCAFGGHDLKTLYITTAKDGLFQARLNMAGIAECPASISTNIDTGVYKIRQVHSS